MNLEPGSRIADVAREYPSTIRVFQGHGIDFCCGGKLPIAEACARHGVSTEALLAELRATAAGSSAAPQSETDVNWTQRSTPELVGHILARFHSGLREELTRLTSMALRAAERHGDTHAELLEIADLVPRLADEMREHLEREERTLFPALLSGETRALAAEFAGAESEHRAVGDLLFRLRRASDGFRAPAEACNTWRGLFYGLAELERDTHLHVHLENNILFPRAGARIAAPACSL